MHNFQTGATDIAVLPTSLQSQSSYTSASRLPKVFEVACDASQVGVISQENHLIACFSKKAKRGSTTLFYI